MPSGCRMCRPVTTMCRCRPYNQGRKHVSGSRDAFYSRNQCSFEAGTAAAAPIVAVHQHLHRPGLSQQHIGFIHVVPVFSQHVRVFQLRFSDIEPGYNLLMYILIRSCPVYRFQSSRGDLRMTGGQRSRPVLTRRLNAVNVDDIRPCCIATTLDDMCQLSKRFDGERKPFAADCKT